MTSALRLRCFAPQRTYDVRLHSQVTRAALRLPSCLARSKRIFEQVLHLGFSRCAPSAHWIYLFNRCPVEMSSKSGSLFSRSLLRKFSFSVHTCVLLLTTYSPSAHIPFGNTHLFRSSFLRSSQVRILLSPLFLTLDCSIFASLIFHS